jgi:hypothetical protein
MYLKGSCNYLDRETAIQHAINHKPAVAREDRSDNTWSVFYLSETPVQPNQSEFRMRPGDYLTSCINTGKGVTIELDKATKRRG